MRGSITNLSFEKPTDGTITISTEEWGKVSFSTKPDEYIAACGARGEGQIISVKESLLNREEENLGDCSIPQFLLTVR